MEESRKRKNEEDTNQEEKKQKTEAIEKNVVKEFDLFISHRQKEAEAVARSFHETLSHKFKLKCFLDREIVEEADDLGKLQDFVKKSKCLLFILTRTVLKSKWLVCLESLLFIPLGAWLSSKQLSKTISQSFLSAELPSVNLERIPIKPFQVKLPFFWNGIFHSLFEDLDDDQDCLKSIQFEGKTIPIREKIRKAFEQPALVYSLDFHQESMQKIVNKMVKLGIVQELKEMNG